MEYYGWSLKKKIFFVLFVGSAIVLGGVLYLRQRSKGCPIECWYRQQETLRQLKNGQEGRIPAIGSNDEKP